ncbi:hypothetical protein [Peribacillus sp. JNUCC41]|uniref:hypothetical protein n=1 Tax=Peribacillus sp. JNUCC41 TaxID=2778370 RepID=UPI001783CC01|nr:hypothetical protein [Brevibacillus sp. JNUCC-41]QOS88753.1 hypothetical protein JNUCC41_18290 [Brevibacillus sp. JNUCC-41]
MDDVDISPLTEGLNNIAMQFVFWMAICWAAYVIVIIILRIIKVPDKIAHFFATAAFLIALYYSFVNGYVPGIQ